MYGLDLFSGIGGLTKALEGYVTPGAYCEIDRYARSALLSRMSTGDLPSAPIWDDITTLRGNMLPGIEIIYGGFPCQDISIAGRGEGLGGKRSGLFFEIVRLAKEIKPKFLFLENVPNIRTKGLSRVVRELADTGYDCRWCTVSAAEVGAPHLRKRWFLLAHSRGVECEPRAKESGILRAMPEDEPVDDHACRSSADVSNANGSNGRLQQVGQSERHGGWTVEPNVGRVADGVPFRVDRIRALGNAVVPAQAREAFERLIGIRRTN